MDWGNADSHYNAKGRRTAIQKGPAERGQVTHEGAERVSLLWLFHGRWHAERKEKPRREAGAKETRSSMKKHKPYPQEGRRQECRAGQL